MSRSVNLSATNSIVFATSLSFSPAMLPDTSTTSVRHMGVRSFALSA
eukprot:CAMPEP_0119201398 /NCGR_PEP_ID=MMETSP1316-20130426/28995_1 /TAXON_ID=41880 /ORGANISM="Pycnococcus provasolii, Strain RCC2336" /LENGTH=46 /DNA_ID= /DNA_START= /DNA_END= /DNA_ORIENTATION=